MVANAIIQRYKNDDSYLKSLAGRSAAAATGVGKRIERKFMTEIIKKQQKNFQWHL